ncbi:MAG: hypothetical protein QXM07_09515 [Nitrososphaerota archaeon]
MPELVERSIQKIAVKGVNVSPNARVELLRLTTSSREKFIILSVDVKKSDGTVAADIDIEIKRIIGSTEQLVNPAIKGDFMPVRFGDIILGIRGDVPERFKEGLVIPEIASLVVSAYNPTAAAVSLNCVIEYIKELYV